jgi:hypothetical protein
MLSAALKPGVMIRIAPPIIALAGAGAIAALEISGRAVPLAAYFATAALWALTGLVLIPRPRLRDWLLGVMVLFASLSATEMIFAVAGRPSLLRVTRPKLAQPDSQLGYGPIPGVTVEDKEFHRNRIVYDAVYTIGKNGLRMTPGSNPKGSCKVVFFGCSFVFGQGLNDNQTVPSYFARAGGGRYSVFNFGFLGYGPHQMLRAIESGRMARVAGRPNLVVYEAITDHVRRVAGDDQWDRYGPRYVLDGASVHYDGPFHRGPSPWKPVMARCATCRFISAHTRWHRTAHDIALFAAVVARARDLVERLYGARFVVVLWDNSGGSREVIDALAVKQIAVIRVTTIIPQLKQGRTGYVISPLDSHPNAKANRLIGDYLASVFGGCDRRSRF